MSALALKILVQDKFRLAMGVGGVGLAVMLILVLDGMFAGVDHQITAYLDATGPDLIVAQKDSRNFLGARSTVPREDIATVKRVRGVRKVVPVIVQYVILDLGGRKEFSLMIGFDRERGGGPWQLQEGRAALGKDDVIFDAVVAARHGIGLGDRVTVLGKDLRVVGLSGGTSSWMTGTFFVTYDTASDLVAARGNPSFLLVTLDPGASVDTVTRLIERRTRLTATPRPQVDSNDIALYDRILSGPLRLMDAVAFLIGVALIGLTLYTATVERSKEYAALKAIGLRNVGLYSVVLQQALVLSAAGFVAGVGLAFAVQRVLQQFAPQFLVLIDLPSGSRLFAVALAMGALSALAPARAVALVDPAEAFRRGA